MGWARIGKLSRALRRMDTRLTPRAPNPLAAEVVSRAAAAASAAAASAASAAAAAAASAAAAAGNKCNTRPLAGKCVMRAAQSKELV